MGKRLAEQRTAESAPREKILNAVDALDYCKNQFIRLARVGAQEEFHVILLDSKYNVIKSERITVGLLNESLAHPRILFKPAIRGIRVAAYSPPQSFEWRSYPELR